ncbi:MAG: iron-sulfur cluster assembly protein [Pseudomonadota bacterium]
MLYDHGLDLTIPTDVDQILLDKIANLPLKEQAYEILRTIFDPEIPVNIVELGLIYDVFIIEDSSIVTVNMTLTAPACPVAGTMPEAVKQKLEHVPAIKEAIVELVWDPPWHNSMMSEAARLELGIF